MDILRKTPHVPPDPSKRYDEVVKVWAPGRLQKWVKLPDGLECVCDRGIALRVEIFSTGTVRFRYALNGAFERDFSYALAEGAHSETAPFRVEETAFGPVLRVEGLEIRVHPEGLRTTVLDGDGQVLMDDGAGFSAEVGILGGNLGVSMDKAVPVKTAYYGLGDKACEQDLGGKTFHLWCEDAFAFGEHTDQQYRAVPFFYALRAGRAYGIFFDNTHRSRFSFGLPMHGEKKKPDRTLRTGWSAEGGEMRYYFFAGPALADVSRRYHRLTGLPELPPIWALGYHQCRWSYFPEKRVLDIARKFRRLDIPCDAIWLDIDYMDAYRCFTWHPERFPDPEGLVRKLENEGFKTVVMIDPGIQAKPGYKVYDSGSAGGHFCRRSDGDVFLGPVWPGDCVFPDFTRPATREWWASLYGDFLRESGVHGVWNDMNEPAVFEVHRKTFPDAVLHDHDGAPCDHRRAHNVYGLLMSRATAEGIHSVRPDRRPFVLSRASFSGGQRYAALWTGDNIASWEHLRIGMRQCLRMALSGFSFCGTDIGGFVDRPSGELYVRWLQLAVFHPLMRTHSMGDHLSGDAAVDESAYEARSHEHRMDQEPWAFGDRFTGPAREAIRLRYRLLPYLYSSFWEHCQTGVPLMRPVGFDENEPLSESAFYFGSRLMVSPVLRPQQKSKRIALPKGCSWYPLDGNAAREGGESVSVATPLGRVPIFVREGTVLPLAPVGSHSQTPFETLTLKIFWAAGNSEDRLYEDAGDGHTHLNGDYRLSRFRLFADQNKALHLERTTEGSYRPAYTAIELVFVGLPEGDWQVVADGIAVATENEPRGTVCTAPADFGRIELQRTNRL